MSYEIPNLRFGATAGGSIAVKRFVKVAADEDFEQCGDGEAAIGASRNQADAGEIVDVADGIVMVEAGAAVAAAAEVQSDANGKAITKAAGLGLGVAMTAAAATGVIIAVKIPGIGATGDATIKKTIEYKVEDLAAGADIADIPFFVVPTGYTFVVTEVEIISQGTPADIDDSNTCVVLVEEGSDQVVAETFDTTTAFPAAGTKHAMGTVTNGSRVAGDVLTISVTNGATADPPAFMVQVTGSLALA